MGASLTRFLSPTPDIYTSFPATGKAYFEDIRLASEKNYNFFNPNDGAVGTNYIWPLDEALKPDSSTSFFPPAYAHLNYSYNGTNFIETASHLNQLVDPFSGSVTYMVATEWSKALNLGVQYDAYGAMAFSAEAKSKGLGALGGVGFSFVASGEVNLRTDLDSIPAIGSNFNGEIYDHGGQFAHDNVRR